MNFQLSPEQALAATQTRTRNTELWKRYKRTRPGSTVENELVQQYLPLVKTVVGKLAMSLPPHVGMEDLYSAGLVGLLNAVRNFDQKMGTIFEGYARLRIRGAVLDELRRMDWVPRSVHVKARQIEAAMRELEQKKGRIPTDAEMAAKLKLSPAEYEKWIDDVRPATFLSLDALTIGDSDDGTGRYEFVPDSAQEDPGDASSRHELARLVFERMQQLPDVQRKVLALYYFEDLRLREIAAAFGLTESRICQIHSKAILSIRCWLTKVESVAA